MSARRSTSFARSACSGDTYLTVPIPKLEAVDELSRRGPTLGEPEVRYNRKAFLEKDV